MSRSRKDGARGGGHKDAQCKEFWSPRKPNAVQGSRIVKDITHRKERARNRAIEHDALTTGETDAPKQDPV